MSGNLVPLVELPPSDGQDDDEEKRISNGQQANGREGHSEPGECVRRMRAFCAHTRNRLAGSRLCFASKDMATRQSRPVASRVDCRCVE